MMKNTCHEKFKVFIKIEVEKRNRHTDAGVLFVELLANSIHFMDDSFCCLNRILTIEVSD